MGKWLEPAEWWPEHAEDEETMLVVAGRRKTVTIAQLLQSFDSPEPMYADGAGNPEPFAFLEPELLPQRPNFTAALDPMGTNLWVGSKTVSRFHYDSCENIFVQLVGAKRLRLLPPVCTAALVSTGCEKHTWAQEASAVQRAFLRNVFRIMPRPTACHVRHKPLWFVQVTLSTSHLAGGMR